MGSFNLAARASTCNRTILCDRILRGRARFGGLGKKFTPMKVGSFCCPVLPVPLESASVARCGPDRAKPCNLYPRRAFSYAARASASLSLALVGLNGFAAHSGRAKTSSLNTRRSWFGPVRSPRFPEDLWWSRRVLPPGPLHLFHDIIYRHSRQAGTAIYRRAGLKEKGPETVDRIGPLL